MTREKILKIFQQKKEYYLRLYNGGDFDNKFDFCADLLAEMQEFANKYKITQQEYDRFLQGGENVKNGKNQLAKKVG